MTCASGCIANQPALLCSGNKQEPCLTLGLEGSVLLTPVQQLSAIWTGQLSRHSIARSHVVMHGPMCSLRAHTGISVLSSSSIWLGEHADGWATLHESAAVLDDHISCCRGALPRAMHVCFRCAAKHAR